MVRFEIGGRVHPDCFHVNSEAKHTFEFFGDPGETLGTFEVEIVESAITATFDVPTLTQDVVDTAMMRASELCQSMVDVWGLRRGLKLFAILDRWIDPDGVETALVYGDQPLGALMTVMVDDAVVDEILEIALDDLPLRHAITDLMSMLWWPSYAPIACGRVVDSIRRMISPPDTPDGTAWKAMREALNLDEAYLKFVTDTSRGPRHGHRVEVSGEDNREISIRAWTVMNRYLAFIRNDRQPLSTKEFPLLFG